MREGDAEVDLGEQCLQAISATWSGRNQAIAVGWSQQERWSVFASYGCRVVHRPILRFGPQGLLMGVLTLDARAVRYRVLDLVGHSLANHAGTGDVLR